MIGGVIVLSVPAGRESHRHSPATTADLVGEALGVVARAGCAAKGILLDVGQAAVAVLTGHLAGLSVAGVAHEHAEALW